MLEKIYVYRKWRRFYYSLLHILAMLIPFSKLRQVFYKLRGTKIGKNVHITSFVFLEESYPGLITIEDNVDIGPNVTIVTHDSSPHLIYPSVGVKCKPVLIRKNAYIGACAIILPGVTIGENSLIAAGAVVIRDVQPYTIVAGNPAKKIGMVEDETKTSPDDIYSMMEEKPVESR